MTDYEALVKWLREFEGPGSNGTNEAADAVEALVAERDALRAQLDGMTVEKTTVPQFVPDKDTGDNRLDLLPRTRGHFEFPLMKRLVGPWVDAEGVSDGQQ